MKTLGQLIACSCRILRRAFWKKSSSFLATSVEEYALRLRHPIPPILVKALVFGEDRRFYRHSGVDPVAIAGVTWRLARRGRISGASTIEQQLVRVLTGDKRRTIRRKAREIALACILDTLCEKPKIASVYMSIAYFGWQMNGVEKACLRMGIELSSMTPRQAAGLVARLKYPEPHCPSTQRQMLIARRTEYLLALLSPIANVTANEAARGAAFLDN